MNIEGWPSSAEDVLKRLQEQLAQIDREFQSEGWRTGWDGAPYLMLAAFRRSTRTVEAMLAVVGFLLAREVKRSKDEHEQGATRS